MSGLYLIGVVALWLWLTSLLWKGLHRWRAEKGERGLVRNGTSLLIVLLWFGISFWYGGGRKFYYDWQVDKMCAVDGGIKVYETVELPADKFSRYGQIRIPPKRNARSGDDYYYETDMKYLESSAVEMWELEFGVYRAIDNKLLGIARSYGRRGGDLPGPWHKSSFTCPAGADITDLKAHIFIKE